MVLPHCKRPSQCFEFKGKKNVIKHDYMRSQFKTNYRRPNYPNRAANYRVLKKITPSRRKLAVSQIEQLERQLTSKPS